MWKRFLIAGAVALAAACSPAADTSVEGAPTNAAITPIATEAPAGLYRLDPMHASLVVRVSHLGFANYVVRFTRWDGELTLDPANPEAAVIVVRIDPTSLASDNPPDGFLHTLVGADWLNAGAHPEITFRSTEVTLTGENTARIAGALTLLGVTQPVTLDASFGGGYAGHPLDPQARIGFSAQGAFDRSDFGMTFGLPPEGTTMGVGDRVSVQIEAEFKGPAWANAPPAQP